MDNQLLKDLGYTLMQSRQAAALVLREGSLSLAELLTLGSIEHNDPACTDNVYADDLQDLLCVSKPAISQMMRSLEKAGYITREINPENRRKLDVIITGHGREALSEALRCYKETLTRIVNAYGEEQTRTLVAMYAAFINTAKAVRGDEDGCEGRR